MQTPDFRLYWWIKNNMGRVKHNLSSSGLGEPDLAEMGVRTDYSELKASGLNPEEEFRRSVASLYGVRPENVVPTVGGTEAIYLVGMLVAQSLKRFYVPTPNYEPMFTVPHILGLKGVKHPAGGEPVYVALTDSNNPTGRSLREEWVEGLLNSLVEGSMVFIDETFREFGFPESPKTWFHADSGRIIVGNTLTKFYGLGGFRVGWVIASEDVVGELSRLKPYLTGENASYSLWIGAQAIRNRQRFVERAKRIVERNRRMVEEFVESTPGIHWSNPDAAPFCLIEYDWEVSSEKLCLEALREAGVLVAPAEFFGAQNGFRLCFTHSDGEKLSEALRALSGFLGGRFR